MSTDMTQNNSILQKNQHLQKLTNCRTPDSMLSTGSASVYSNLLGRSSSTFMLPEKLQIVKPLEGSNTLQHWQKLGTPNLGCLFEKRPGITIKGNSPDEASKKFDMQERKESNLNMNNYLDEDDGVNLDMYEEDDDELDFNFSNNNNNDFDSSDPNNLFNEKFSMSLNTSFTESDDSEPKKNHRFFSPSKFKLLSRLLESDDEPRVEEAEKETKNNFFMSFIKNFSTKFNFNSTNTTEFNETLRKNKRQECDDPDTPPSSPINLPNSNSTLNQNIFYEVYETAKLKCQSAFVAPISSYFKKSAPTPPGTPTNCLELNDDYVSEGSSESEEDAQQVNNNLTQPQNFFDQIVSKLNLFSFKSVSQQSQVPPVSNQNSVVIKPSPIYSSNTEINKDFFSLNENQDENVDEDEDKEIVEIRNTADTTTSTPPPSPSKFSPPLLMHQNDDVDDYDEEEMKKSAFVKVTSLNPYLNKSVDLASLLGSLSSLKRNQRLCKYNQAIYRNNSNSNKNST
jgi:hypothetical protein